MQKGDSGKPGIVPFPKFFSVLGYAAFWLALILGFLEGGSWLAWEVYRQQRAPRKTPNENSEILARVRGQSERQINGTSDDVWLERLGGEQVYKRWIDQMSASTAYAKSEWAEEFWSSERQRLAHWSFPYEPFRVWGSEKWEGKFVNNVQTEMGVLRRTVGVSNPACAERAPLRVWLFGGSTAWGVGVPDAETVPSHLARRVNAAGENCFEVTNLGVEGYVSNQELIFLIQQLKSGRRPDIVIFYDGLNDACVGGVGGTPEGHHFLLAVKSAFESSGSVTAALSEKSNFLRLVRALRRRVESRSKEPDVSARAIATLANYEANIAIARTLGEKYGFKAWFFWQPMLLFGKKPLDSFEQDLFDEEEDQARDTFLAVRAVYEEAERRSNASGNFVFLGHLWDDVQEPIYIDWMHVGPRGNELIAAAIAADLQRTLPIPAKASPQRPNGTARIPH